MSVHYLEHLFSPRSIAMIGASQRTGSLDVSPSTTCVRRICGRTYRVNPKYQSVAGLPCYPSIAAIGHAVDLILVTTPAPLSRLSSTRLVRPAREAQWCSLLVSVKSALAPATRAKTACCGTRPRPALHWTNCLASCAAARAQCDLCAANGFARINRPGFTVRAVAAALVDGAQASEIGFSNVISMGAGIDLDIGEILDYLTQDSPTAAS